ncbi:hypothetical protein WJX81_002771 [Elliptochloris bilobata]|uniref:Suppressor of forked domain-containing protein n=1 Tax=Elliptochloris bilobata TaxID=381761 RepID=A0AAW1RXH3_9CHLO
MDEQKASVPGLGKVEGVQDILDQNKVLINEINSNHEARTPEALARNVVLIQELNSNVSKVLDMYSELTESLTQLGEEEVKTETALQDKVAAHRARIAADVWDAAAWQALAADIGRAVGPGKPAPELLTLYRSAMEQLLAQFPTAAIYWQQYAEVELAAGNTEAVKTIFGRCLLHNLHVDLWRLYLRFIKQVNGARGGEGVVEVRWAYEYTLDRVGTDIGASPLWQEFIAYLQAPRPGTPAYQALFGGGPAGQEDAQRTMLLRRAFQRALAVPSPALEALWRAYEQFEAGGPPGPARVLGRRILDEHRPRYQAARSALRERQARLAQINPGMLPLPPGKGGAAQAAQAAAWQRYLAWERSNVQHLDGPALAARVMLAYDQALGPLVHFPEVWYDFARWHSAEGGSGPAAAAAVLARARQTLPSCLMLHFAAAELEEERGDADAVRAVFEGLVAGLVAPADAAAPEPPPALQLSPELGSLAWVHYMRWARRADGLAASRKLFIRSRKWPACGWQVYAAAALMEWQGERADKVPRNIFELGLRHFLGQPGYVAAYAGWLVTAGDAPNARALFERALAGQPAPEAARALWDHYLKFEVEAGDSAAVRALEARRRDALGDPPPYDNAHTLLLKYRMLDLWPCTDEQRLHLERLLGLAPALAEDTSSAAAADGSSAWPGAPVSPGALPGPSPHRSPGGALLNSETLQLPPELGRLLGALPPPQAVDGPIPSVDAFIELLLVVDVSPAAAAAADAAAAHAARLPPAPRLAPPPGAAPFGDAGPPANLPQPGGEEWGSSGAVKRPHGGDGEPEENGVGAAQPPAHDVFRQRRKLQRSRAAGGEG